MHELFTKVLGKRDLSRAGDLFSVADAEIVADLTEVVSVFTFQVKKKIVAEKCLRGGSMTIIDRTIQGRFHSGAKVVLLSHHLKLFLNRLNSGEEKISKQCYNAGDEHYANHSRLNFKLSAYYDLRLKIQFTRENPSSLLTIS